MEPKSRVLCRLTESSRSFGSTGERKAFISGFLFFFSFISSLQQRPRRLMIPPLVFHHIAILFLLSLFLGRGCPVEPNIQTFKQMIISLFRPLPSPSSRPFTASKPPQDPKGPKSIAPFGVCYPALITAKFVKLGKRYLWPLLAPSRLFLFSSPHRPFFSFLKRPSQLPQEDLPAPLKALSQPWKFAEKSSLQNGD